MPPKERRCPVWTGDALDVKPVSVLRGASVLVTGGSGSFGRAFVRYALENAVRRIVVFSRDEAKHAAMRTAISDPRVRYFVGDVRDMDRVQWAMRGVDLVVHAAAMKRIDSCEADPTEAIQTNILGSQNVALAAIQARVARAVLLSTDKAAAPCTLYGMTKATAERAWIQSNAYADGTGTLLAATRYGNVLGSTGSVVPLWRAAAAANAPIYVTESSATRFWMPMRDAVQLVVSALTRMQGGETFVPKLGAASVLNLLSAVVPEWRTHTVVNTGLRVGEKAHETLIGTDEADRTVDAGEDYVICPAYSTWGDRKVRATGGLAQAVSRNFTLRSDNVDISLDVPALQAMLAE